MLAILQYGVGNIFSLCKAIERIGAPYIVTSNIAELEAATHIILPGVGEASSVMKEMEGSGLIAFLRGTKKPVLGICIGMQVMCSYSQEGDTECMGLFSNEVEKFKVGKLIDNKLVLGNRDNLKVGKQDNLKVGNLDNLKVGKQDQDKLIACKLVERSIKIPHMGWNRVTNTQGALFNGIKDGEWFYFVHSYAPTLGSSTIATTEHGVIFSGALNYKNYYGTQFHPEKSGEAGQQLLHNFISL